MAKFDLHPHPDAPPKGVTSVVVTIDPFPENPAKYRVEFGTRHDGALALPAMLEPGRSDDLWKTTCCEVFVMPDGGSDYIEFNLSPSFRWAAYGFDGYRSGMHNIDLVFDPEIEVTTDTPGWFFLAAELDLSSLASLNAAINLTAVIEETDGAKSFWALSHAVEVPDFHNAACFTGRLPKAELTA